MNKKQSYDFSGWATKYGIKCSDGRTIMHGAFTDNDGLVIPLVWNHDHTNATSVIGKATLCHKEEGVYAYCSLNDTEYAKTAKVLVEHGDITSLSIYANRLKQNGNEVIHGQIRELSLVLAGANPEARIDNVLAHGELTNNDEYVCWAFDSDIAVIDHSDNSEEVEENTSNPADDSTEEKSSESEEVVHADEEQRDETVADVFNTLTEEQKNAVYALMAASMDENPEETFKNIPEEAKGKEGSGKTLKDVFDTLSEKQKTVVYAIIGQLIDQKAAEEESAAHSNMEEDANMKINVFEGQNDQTTQDEGKVLTHSEFTAIMNDTKRIGNLKDAFLEHSITNVDVLMPDHKAVGAPETLSREMTWVDYVLSAVKHTPFSRIKSRYFDITADEARAKGYVTGNKKVEEVIAAYKRTTDPQTVYKLQKLDRDTYLDITEFDVVAYMKQEMRAMLNEELARAILIGDGRSSGSTDKVDPTHIRPIWGDNSAYTTNVLVARASGQSDEAYAKAFIRAARKNRKLLKGSGRPVMLCGEDFLNDLLAIEDTNGHFIYEDEEKLAKALRVSKIVPVPVMDGLKRTNDEETKDYKFIAMIVNLNDYDMGADKGGNVSFFDDFNLDYNKMEYLIETRASGALVKPKCALTFEEEVDHAA